MGTLVRRPTKSVRNLIPSNVVGSRSKLGEDGYDVRRNGDENSLMAWGAAQWPEERYAYNVLDGDTTTYWNLNNLSRFGLICIIRARHSYSPAPAGRFPSHLGSHQAYDKQMRPRSGGYALRRSFKENQPALSYSKCLAPVD